MWKANKSAIAKKNLMSRNLVQLGRKIKDYFANSIWCLIVSKLCHLVHIRKLTHYACSCTIFLVQTLLIRPWPKTQHTINLCRGWVKELSLSELIRSDARTILLQEQKHKDGYLTENSISSVPNTSLCPLSLRDSTTLYSSLILIWTLHLLII